MVRWHALFEAQAPAAHEAFLRSLTLPPEEIAAIRRWSRAQAAAAPDAGSDRHEAESPANPSIS